MFGYVTADIRALSKEGRREYKSYYCGLCRALAARYGARARWLLSFDTVFAFILLSALEENPPRFKECRCPYYLGKKRGCCVGDIADYAADITVILAYLNIKDDIADSGSLKARTVEKIYRRSFETARERRSIRARILSRPIQLRTLSVMVRPILTYRQIFSAVCWDGYLLIIQRPRRLDTVSDGLYILPMPHVIFVRI